MKKMLFLILTLFFLGAASMNAQVRIGGTDTPNTNALLDVNKDNTTVDGNNTGGLALPRVSLTSTTVAAPVGTAFVKGMLVYNTNTTGDVTPGAYYSDGSKWIRVSGSDAPVAAWQLGGNVAGANDFIGTTNTQPLIFKVNNAQAGRISNTNAGATSYGYSSLPATSTGNYNSAFGNSALSANTTGAYNNASGDYALNANTKGGYNTAVGASALRTDTTGSYNTAVGYGALYTNKASGNTAVGSYALYANSTGQYNTAVGDSALRANSTASHNTAAGYHSLRANTSGTNNAALGDSTLSKNTGGSNNTAIGSGALKSNTTAPYNTAIGRDALSDVTTGGYNVALGVAAGDSLTTGTSNIIIGTGAGTELKTGNLNLVIGRAAQAPDPAGNSQINIANTVYGTYAYQTPASGRVSIGKTAPDAGVKLDIAGLTQITGANTLKYLDGNQGTGKVLTSDFSGNASWAAPILYTEVNIPIVQPLETVQLNANMPAGYTTMRCWPGQIGTNGNTLIISTLSGSVRAFNAHPTNPTPGSTYVTVLCAKAD